ncbi:MAG: hypothetical protein ACRYF0_04480 [Janthinobacterium lividum]
MNEEVVGIIVLLLLVIGLPLAFGAQEYFQAKKLAQPVVRIACDGWLLPRLLWTLFQTAFGLSLGLAAGYAVWALGAQLASLIVVGILLPAAWWQFPGFRLLWTYWRHDGRAVLVFSRAQKTATYRNHDFYLDFMLVDVKQLASYHPARTRAASADYSYTILTFADGTELVVSNLLCDYFILRTLFPGIPGTAVPQRYAWLPGDLLSRRLFGPFF